MEGFKWIDTSTTGNLSSKLAGTTVNPGLGQWAASGNGGSGMRRTMNDYMGATVEIISGNEKYEIGMVVGFEDHMLVIDLANGGTVRKNVDEIKVKWEE